MGGGQWTDNDYRSYAKTTSYTTASVAEVFSNSRLLKELDPRHIMLRESCDSVEHPFSTPIILGLDVTGSMGRYAAEIAKTELPQLMRRIYEEQPVTSPQLMFMGIDDAFDGSNAPLQCSQFESDIRILEQLRQIWLVSDGGGNGSESYDLPWLFAARKTAIDSYTKRGKKGFLFTFGDEPAPFRPVSKSMLTRYLGEGEWPQEITPAEMLAEAKQSYHVFHILLEEVSGQRNRRSWTDLMGTNVLFLERITDLAELVIATLKITAGQDMETVITESANPSALRHAYFNARANY